MINQVYAIRDLKADYFQNLWLAQNDQVAVRNFRTLVNDKSTQFGLYPEDYDLYLIGSFDQVSGEMLPKLVSICNGSSLKGGNENGDV